MRNEVNIAMQSRTMLVLLMGVTCEVQCSGLQAV
jgi:hypothetical protein